MSERSRWFSLALGVIAASGTAGVALAQRSSPLLPGGNSKAPVSINADKLDYFDKDQKLVYSGSVTAKQGDSTLKSSTLTIFLSNNPAKPAEAGSSAAGENSSDQVRRMEASGPVTIIQKDQVGIGDSGIYDRAENKVYLIGNVSLSQGTNVIKGRGNAKLIYDLTSGQARIDGGVSSLFTPGSGDSDGKKPASAPKKR